MEDEPLKLELNIALIPDDELAQRLAEISNRLAKRYRAFIQLGGAKARLVMAPHLTLYQVPLLLADVDAAARLLAVLARQQGPFRLAATEYLYNAGEASFEVDYELPKTLMNLQAKVIGALNPLRGKLLLERDPAGNDMREFLQKTGRQSEDVRRTGYWEVGDPAQGGFFRPHATLNWFERGTAIDVEQEKEILSDIKTLSGHYEALGIYLLGPNGTCPQLLERYELGNKPF